MARTCVCAIGIAMIAPAALAVPEWPRSWEIPVSDGQQPADLPLPENAIKAAEDVITSWRHSPVAYPSSLARTVLAAAAPVLRAQGAAAERERMMARAAVNTLAAIGEDDFSPAARTVADIVLADLLAGDAP